MATPTATVWMITAIAISLSVVGQLALKAGMRRIVSSDGETAAAVLLGAAVSPYVLAGIVSSLAGTALWLVVLAHMDLSVAYPLSGLSHVLITLLSWLVLGETVRRQRWLGVILIVFGAVLVTCT